MEFLNEKGNPWKSDTLLHNDPIKFKYNSWGSPVLRMDSMNQPFYDAPETIPISDNDISLNILPKHSSPPGSPIMTGQSHETQNHSHYINSSNLENNNDESNKDSGILESINRNPGKSSANHRHSQLSSLSPSKFSILPQLPFKTSRDISHEEEQDNDIEDVHLERVTKRYTSNAYSDDHVRRISNQSSGETLNNDIDTAGVVRKKNTTDISFSSCA